MKNTERVPVRQPDRVLSYFENQRPVLAVVTVSGLIYNLGLVVGPWFEGQLAQYLLGILNGNETFAAMAALCAGYLIAIAVVQGSRFIKRLYVRKFANNINRSMKRVLYANLVRKDKVELEQAGTGVEETVLPACLRLEKPGDVTAYAAFGEGRFHVQDLSSQLCCQALDVRPGMRVLDACSAPGGKTFTLAEQMENQGEVVACDLYPARVGLIQSGGALYCPSPGDGRLGA
mgnify:CR=1 FL=1